MQFEHFVQWVKSKMNLDAAVHFMQLKSTIMQW